jgi:O-antigen ligase
MAMANIPNRLHYRQQNKPLLFLIFLQVAVLIAVFTYLQVSLGILCGIVLTLCLLAARPADSLRILLVAIPFYILMPIGDFWVSTTALVAYLMCITLFLKIMQGETRLPSSPLYRSIGLLLLVMLISLSYSVDLLESLKELFRWGSFLIVFFITLVALGKENRNLIPKLLWLIIVIAAVQVIVGAILMSHLGEARMRGTTAGPNTLAAYLVLCLPLAGSIYFSHQEKYSKRWLAGLISVILMAGIFMTGSRGGLMAATASLGILAVYKFSRQRIRVMKYIAVIALAIIVLLSSTPILKERIFHTWAYQGYKVDTAVVRLLQFSVIWEMIKERPFLGSGLGTFRHVFGQRVKNNILITDYTAHAHNIYLHIWAELGTAGLLVVLWLFWKILRLSKSATVHRCPLSRDILVPGIMGSVVGFGIHGLVDTVIFSLNYSSNI